MNGLMQDLRYALRTLRKSPGFALVAILTLTIGIASVSAIFSIADTALLNPLPFPHAEQLVTVNEVVPLFSPRPIRLTAPDMLDYETGSRSFAAMGGWIPKTVELSGARESMRVQAVRATASFFRVLQISPLQGRAFDDAEDTQGETVCVISYGLWQRWFGADPHAVGGTIDLDRIPYKVIGVMPRGFEFPWRGNSDAPDGADLWVPMSLTPAERAARADNWSYNGIARLKPGVTIDQASADVNAIAQRIRREMTLPAELSSFAFSAVARPMAEQVSGRVRPLVLALLGAVAFVLLIACANVANLLLARATRREREIAVRVALGASRPRILRQLLTETLVLAGIAAIAGALLAWWSTALLGRFVPTRFAVLGSATFRWPVLLSTAAIAVATALLVGLAPGLTATGSLPFLALRERGGSGGAKNRTLRSALVVAEMALAVVLLVGAGLLIRSFRDLLSTDPGFAPENAVAGLISLPESEYGNAARERQLYREVIERMRAFPGMEFAGAASAIPLNGPRRQRAFWPEGYTPPPNARANVVSSTAVYGDYFQAIGATLLRGRFFTPQDNASAPPVAIVTESIASKYWRGKDPVGKRLRWGLEQGHNEAWLTVVGVVADLKQDTLDSASDPQVLVPADQLQNSEPNGGLSASRVLRSMYLVARGHGSSSNLITAVRNSVHSADAHLAIADLEPLRTMVAASAAPQRFNMLMMVGFGAIALLLAAIGIYGVISYSVAQRTQEIGIRMALGATADGVAAMVLRSGLGLAIIGVAIGTLAAAGVAPLLKALLYGVKPLDPLTFVVVAAGLIVVAGVASYVPARRATKVDPMVALRYE